MRQQWKSTPMHSASKVRTLTRTVYHQLSTQCCCLTKNPTVGLLPICSAEYFLFCEMLLQRPINMRQLGLSNILSREETAYMREMASHRFDSIMQVLKSMPRPMLLVFRNINTVRSINITLGAPVDRYFVMAKRWVQRPVTLNTQVGV